jgi:hypothetical protein
MFPNWLPRPELEEQKAWRRARPAVRARAQTKAARTKIVENLGASFMIAGLVLGPK